MTKQQKPKRVRPPSMQTIAAKMIYWSHVVQDPARVEALEECILKLIPDLFTLYEIATDERLDADVRGVAARLYAEEHPTSEEFVPKLLGSDCKLVRIGANLGKNDCWDDPREQQETEGRG